jgi:protein-S-isoprenylcysteine O-methyltransferase Ste14
MATPRWQSRLDEGVNERIITIKVKRKSNVLNIIGILLALILVFGGFIVAFALISANKIALAWITAIVAPITGIWFLLCLMRGNWVPVYPLNDDNVYANLAR